MITVCQTCKLAIRTLLWNQETDYLIGAGSSFWPSNYPCPECSRLSSILEENAVDPSSFAHLTVMDLTAQEAFVAYMGAGLPPERTFSKEEIESLLKDTPIRKVKGGLSGGKYVLESLEMWNGTRLFFGASPEGSVIYRVAQPHKYAERKNDQ